MNNQEVPKTIKEIDFKVSKPYITFGLHYDEVDVNFYNFDLRDDFRDYHFNFEKTYEVLPEIKNADTILQFTLPYEQDLEKQTYLLLNIWGNETLWRIHATQTIYYQNKVALQFDCKRDFFNEYFSLKRNEFKLENVYLLRSNIMKPSLENLRICSNACLNDTTPKQVILDSGNRGKKLITSQEFDGNKYWEIATTNIQLVKNVFNELLPRYSNLFLEKFFALIKDVKQIKDVLYKPIPYTFGWERDYKSGKSSYYYDYYWTLNGERRYSFEEVSQGVWTLDATDYANQKKLISWRPLKEGYYYERHSDGFGKGDVFYGFNSEKIKYWCFPTVKLNYTTLKGSYAHTPCNDRCSPWAFYQVINCLEIDSGKPNWYYVWYNDYAKSFCGTAVLKWVNEFSYKYMPTISNTIRQEGKDFGGDGGFREPDDINSATYFNNQEPRSIYINFYKQESYIRELARSYNVNEGNAVNVYNQSITDFMTVLKNRLGVRMSEVSLDNAAVQYFETVAFADFKLYDDKGNSTGYSQNLLELKFAKRVRTRQFKVYNAKTLTNHYDATHIKEYIVGNSIGVFNVDRTRDYEVVNRDSGEQIVFPTELSEILETGNITIEKNTLEQIGQGQLELEKVRALLELRDKQGDLLTTTKINRVNRDSDYQKQHIIDSANIDRNAKIFNLIGTGIGAVAGGVASGGAFAGISRGAYLGNRLASNLSSIISTVQHRNLNVDKLEFKTKNEVADLWDDNEMSKKFKNEQFDLENYFNMKVSGHLVNTNTIKFPWIDSRRALYLLRLSFGSKDKINYEREVFGDFINQYVDIDKSKLLGRSFILIDTNKSDVLDFPGLNAIGQEIIKRLLNKGIFIFNPNKQSTGITRVW